MRGYLGRRGGIRFVEKCPNLGFEILPPGECTCVVGLLVTEHPGHLLIAGPLGVEVQFVEYRQGGLKQPHVLKINSKSIYYELHRRMSYQLMILGNTMEISRYKIFQND